MYKHKTVKKSLILLVAALMCLAVLLAACSEKPFTPSFDAPKGGKVDSNGGIAVKYGDYIYYVNGNESSTGAANTYVDTKDAPRVGSIVRIKAADIATILEIQEDSNLTSSKKTENVAKAVREKTEIVVPKIYYSNNSATTEINGIYIFNDRLYMLTPNDKLTAGGNPQTNQSVLMSFDLNGGNPQRHFTFTSNSAQVWLYEKDNKVMATYLMNSQLYVLDVANDEKSVSTPICKDDETVSSVKFDLSDGGQCLFFLDGDGSICKLAKGSKEKEVIVNNAVEGDDTSTISYTISSVSNGFVYFTKADSDNSNVDNVVLYYANSDNKVTTVNGEPKVALDTANVTATGWKDNKVVIVSQTANGYYGLYLITSTNGKDRTPLLLPGFNQNAITIWKIEGDDLYYTAGGITYVKNLADTSSENYDKTLGTPYAASTLTSVTSWATPDIVTVGEHIYVFSFGAGSVSVVEFDAEKKTDSAAATLTLTASED